MDGQIQIHIKLYYINKKKNVPKQRTMSKFGLIISFLMYSVEGPLLYVSIRGSKSEQKVFNSEFNMDSLWQVLSHRIGLLGV